MLAKEPCHGYELRARLQQALGPTADALNAGQIYVTLSRLEKAGLITGERSAGLPDRPERKVHELTPAGQQRVTAWLADPVAIIDAQRRELLRRLRDAQRAAMADPGTAAAGLLLEGLVITFQADLRWLEACEQYWTSRRD